MGEKEKTNFSLTGIEDDLIKAARQVGQLIFL